MTLSIVIGLLILALWWLVFVGVMLSARQVSGWRRWAVVAGCLLVIWGVTGFFSSAFTHGKPRLISSSTEWPVGYTSHVVTTTSGMYVVGVESAARIQVYDSDWKFVRGWFIDSHGGVFKIAALENDRVRAITARGGSIITYDLEGNALEQSTYSGNEYESFATSERSAWVRTAPWLVTFANPEVAFVAMVSGIVSLILVGRVTGPSIDGSREVR